MGLNQEYVLEITCDNPACLGNELDPADRAGWTFVTAEIYGFPTLSLVYCCSECVGHAIGPALDETRESALA